MSQDYLCLDLLNVNLYHTGGCQTVAMPENGAFDILMDEGYGSVFVKGESAHLRPSGRKLMSLVLRYMGRTLPNAVVEREL